MSCAAKNAAEDDVEDDEGSGAPAAAGVGDGGGGIGEAGQKPTLQMMTTMRQQAGAGWPCMICIEQSLLISCTSLSCRSGVKGIANLNHLIRAECVSRLNNLLE